MDWPLDGGVADVVRGADDLAAFDAAAGEPDGVAGGRMVAPLFLAGAFSAGSAAEFSGPEDQRRVEQATLLEIHQQCGDGTIRLPRQRRVVAEKIGVGIPE